jgi:hypothetical protein
MDMEDKVQRINTKKFIIIHHPKIIKMIYQGKRILKEIK